MARGDGRLFRYKNSKFWWASYFHKGKEIRESTKQTDERKARTYLRRRRDQLGADRSGGKKFLGPAGEKVTFEDLAANYERDRTLNGHRTSRWAKACLVHLREFFGDERAVGIDTARIRAYAEGRLKEGAAAGTINRELSVVRRMFSLAVQESRLNDRPYITMLKEAQPRQGFFEKPEYLAIRANLPPDYQDVLDLGFFSGWRRGEILMLEWRDVDHEAGVIRLRPELSKNEDGRILALSPPLRAVIERRRQARVIGCPFVFHARGRRIGDWRKAWRRACKAAGLPDKLFHNLRRTVVRNLVRAGVSEKVAMEQTGHKTRSVFDHYNIVSEADLREASTRLAEHLAGMESAPTVVPMIDAKPGENPERRRRLLRTEVR